MSIARQRMVATGVKRQSPSRVDKNGVEHVVGCTPERSRLRLLRERRHDCYTAAAKVTGCASNQRAYRHNKSGNSVAKWRAELTGDVSSQRTVPDKQNAVRTMLTNPLVAFDEDGFPWSDRAIARICKVSHHTVAKWRSELVTGQTPSERAYTNKHGGHSVMNTANIGGRLVDHGNLHNVTPLLKKLRHLNIYGCHHFFESV
jgi:hypothetical protein